ncbi:MAG: N-acetylmuramoyl-L-alanine amidase [Xanthobacteraceae bacterium]|jgi:N-acetylmuramoyl-L-alanine amidase
MQLVWYDRSALRTSAGITYARGRVQVRVQVPVQAGPLRSKTFTTMERESRGMMITLRHAGFVASAVLAMLLIVADRQAARAQQHDGAATKIAATSCRPAAFRVVVDVGHTVDVPGAISARGAAEYGFNLALAGDIKQALVDAGFDSAALLVTSAAPPEGLIERALAANRMAADLFIAIHHDSVPDNLLQAWDYQGQDNHFNDDYPGYAIFVSNDNRDRTGSLAFGHLLGMALKARGLQYTPHYTLPLMGHRRRELLDAEAGVYRYDQLIVLRMTHMPAVLLEAGSIVNRVEELQLASPEHRALTSAAVVAAVQEFCASRTHPAAAKAAASAR